MNHTYLLYDPVSLGELLPAEDIRLGDTVIDSYGNHIGPISRVDYDWPNNWITVEDCNGQSFQCYIQDKVPVLRKDKV